MKQFIYLFSGLLLLFASTPRVVAQEIGDYSQPVSYTHLDVYKRQIHIISLLESKIGWKSP